MAAAILSTIGLGGSSAPGVAQSDPSALDAFSGLPTTVHPEGDPGNSLIDVEGILGTRVPALRHRQTVLPSDKGILRDLLTEGTRGNAFRLRPREWTEMPADPRISVHVLTGMVAALAQECIAHPARCVIRDALQQTMARLQSAMASSPDCGAAAATYQRYYQDGRAPDGDVRAYDLACLNSFVQRQGAAPSAVPTVFTQGGRNSNGEGALRSIGLIELDGIPICGALLRNDRTIVTARHCFAAPATQALRDGKITARPIDGRGGPWKVDPSTDPGPADLDDVGSDWVVARLDTSDAIGAADTQLKAIAEPAAVSLVSYFKDHRRTPYVSAAGVPDWQLGQRWPKPGLCEAIKIEGPCVQLLCQTVTGFSGSPLFLSDVHDPSRPLSVIGFISRPGFTPSNCGTVPGGVTIAVSAAAIH